MDIEQTEKDPQLTQQTEDAFIISILGSLSEKKVIPKTVYENAVNTVLSGDGGKGNEQD